MNHPPKLSFSCPLKWESMSGDDSRRFCASCGKHVHNISLMPAGERRAILEKAASGEHVCVTYLKRTDGEMIVPENTPPSKIIRYGLAAGVAASALSLSACSGPTHPPSGYEQDPETVITGGTLAPDNLAHSKDVSPARTVPGKVSHTEKTPQRLTGDIAPSR